MNCPWHNLDRRGDPGAGGARPSGRRDVPCEAGLLRPEGRAPRASCRAFTLVEMLVVLGIIGILAAMTLPSFKNAGKGNVTESATRQLMDDLALARLKAMSQRSKVYVVFAPDLNFFFGANTLSANTSNYLTTNIAANNLVGGQLTSYALYSPRMVGEQPGQSTPRYLSEWHSLPDGAFIPAGAFRNGGLFHNAFGGMAAPLTNQQILLDDTYVSNQQIPLPFIGFDESGRLFRRTTNIALPIVEGSVMHPKDSTGQTNLVMNTDAVETAQPIALNGIVAGIEYLVLGPLGSWVNYPPGGPAYSVGQTFVGLPAPPANRVNYTPSGNARVVQLYGLRLDWVTGRAKAIRPELQ